MYIDPDLQFPTINYASLAATPNQVCAVPLTVGTLYVFQTPGLQIPPHTHNDRRNHYTLVLSGQFSIDRNGDILLANPRDFVMYGENEIHSITCVKPGCIWNAFKYGVSAHG